MAKSAVADVREAAREVLRLDREGNYAEALGGAVELAVGNPGSVPLRRLAGDLYYAAAIRARRAAGWDELLQPLEEAAAAAPGDEHLARARDELSFAARRVPDCVGIAAALADALAASRMYREAEIEYMRALDISLPVDPALHEVSYGLYGPDPSTVNARVRAARERARLGYDLLTKRLIAIGVQKVLDAGKRDGAAVALPLAKSMAQRFPESTLAQYLGVCMDLEAARSLDPAFDKRDVLRSSTLIQTNNAANAFPKSLVFACFRAKLLFVLGDYDAAERECRRALSIENPDDPEEDSLRPGSSSGQKHGARLLLLADELVQLNLKILTAASDYWESMATDWRRDFLSVRFDALQEEYNKVDHTSGRSGFTIQAVQNFVQEHNSWRFWVCPICQRGTYLDTNLLLSHMCKKHARAVLPSLQSVLDPKATPEIDSLGEFVFCQDSDKNDIICFKERNDMFKWLFNSISTAIIAKPFAEIRKTKCSNGALILENIKKKLRALPADKSSAKFAEIRPEIQELWLRFVKVSVLDYREVILALAREILWTKLKKCMSLDPKVATKRISAADIDAMFSIDADNPISNAISLQTREIMAESRNKLDEKMEKIESTNSESPSATSQCFSSDQKDLSGHQSSTPNKNSAPHTLGQSAEELAITSTYQRNVDDLNKINASEDMYILLMIIQALWNLSHFREGILTGAPVWILRVHDHHNPLLAEVFYHIFSAWNKNKHHGIGTLLTSVKTILCKNVKDSTMFQKLQDGNDFAYEIMDTILNGLHVSETCLHFDFNAESEGQVVNPITCRDCMCRTHNLFGIKFHVQMACGCGRCFNEIEYNTFIHRLDAGSSQTTKIKSFRELPVLWNEQLFCEDNCDQCGNSKDTNLSISNTPHFFIIALRLDGGESLETFSEILPRITSPVDVNLFYIGTHSAVYYTMASMISSVDGRYICFSRDQDRWLIYDAKTIEIEDTWERVLERFRDCKLQPEVLFFEVIK